MATNNMHETLLSALRTIAGGGAPEADRSTILQGIVPDSIGRLPESLGQLASQLGEFRVLSEQQAAAVGENTQAVLQNTLAHSTSTAGSVAATAGKVASGLLGGGLGLIPLVSGLAKLFGGGKTETLPTLTKYTPPASIRLEGALAQAGESGIRPIYYDENSLPRVVPSTPPAGQAQVTIQVQAMDSRSFLDHSEEIARAVRAAMLNSHPLNDVITEL